MGQVLDPYPIAVVFAMFAVLSLVFYEIGFRVGVWYQRRTPGVQEGPTDMLVGSLLALMAFLLAVTMGMASDRFDSRRGLVVAEANAIEAAYLQADYLPDPAAGQLKELLREYVPLRMATDDQAQVQANIQASAALRDQMWAIERTVARSGYLSDLMSALGDSLTAVTNVSQERIVSGIYSRVPPTVLLLLLFGSVLSLAMVGYTAGLRESRSLLTAVVLIVALGAVLVLVLDLDRPRDGFINVSQQSLLDVQQRIGLPTP
jgi:hypothetical protein